MKYKNSNVILISRIMSYIN